MKLFLRKILLFVILLTIGALALNFCIEKGLKKTGYGDFQLWNDIMEKRIDSDVIVLGNSRAFVHFNPEILDSVLNVNSYNIGMGGYPFEMQSAKFYLVEKYNKKRIKTVIQNIDFFTFSPLKEAVSRAQFLPYLQESLLRAPLKKIGFSDFDFFVPAFQYHSELPTIHLGLVEFLGIKNHPKGDYYINKIYKGYAGQEIDWSGAELEVVLSNDSLVFQFDTQSLQLFDSFLNDCKRKDVQVVFVFTPLYYKVTDFTKNKEEVLNTYRFFSEKYDIPFLDYSRDSLCYDTAYFYNAMHLNKKGADLFSLKLANDIKAIRK